VPMLPFRLSYIRCNGACIRKSEPVDIRRTVRRANDGLMAFGVMEVTGGFGVIGRVVEGKVVNGRAVAGNFVNGRAVAGGFVVDESAISTAMVALFSVTTGTNFEVNGRAGRFVGKVSQITPSNVGTNFSRNVSRGVVLDAGFNKLGSSAVCC